MIPTGEFRDVTKTPFDFRKSKTIGKQISEENTQLKIGNGYDHCWVLNGQGKGLPLVASAYDPVSGRLLEVYTDKPGIQFYSGNFLDGTLPSKLNGTYQYRTAFVWKHNIILTHLIREIFHQSDLIQGKI